MGNTHLAFSSECGWNLPDWERDMEIWWTTHSISFGGRNQKEMWVPPASLNTSHRIWLMTWRCLPALPAKFLKDIITNYVLYGKVKKSWRISWGSATVQTTEQPRRLVTLFKINALEGFFSHSVLVGFFLSLCKQTIERRKISFLES